MLDLGHEMYFSVTQKQEMIQGIFNSLRKLDILQEILEQDDVTEIMVNGYQTIFIEKAEDYTAIHIVFSVSRN